ncbi:MAG: ABC transporter permease [Phycisphaerae bacterium]
MATLKLLSSNLRTRPVRTGLTVASVALAVSLVVAVTSGYTSAEGVLFNYLSSVFGSTDVQVTHGTDWRKGMPSSVVDRMRADPLVATAFGRIEAEIGLLDKDGKYIQAVAAELVGVDRPVDDDIARMALAGGKWFDTRTGDVAVIDQRCAELLKVGVGGTIILPAPGDQKRPFKVVGICNKPGFFADKVSSVYVPLETAELLTGRKNEHTRAMVRLHAPAKAGEFVDRWAPLVKAVDTDLRLKSAKDLRKEMDKNIQGMHTLSMLGGAVSLVSAAFIVFSTLSMGVAERQRTLAMLRAIGAVRGQVARLVLAEGVGLTLAGALLGVPLGLFWAWLLTKWRADFFTSGLVVDPAGIWMGIIGAGVAALVAGIIPAFTASRVSPLEAMTPLARPASFRVAIACFFIGLCGVAFDTVSIYLSGASADVKFIAHFAVGLPGIFVGAFLIAPLLVRATDLLLAKPVARLLRVQPRLLRQQLSGAGTWRAAGTAAALMVGLAVLVVLQTVGHTMLSGWKLPTKFPDLFVYIPNQRIPVTDMPRLREIKGIKDGQVTPLVIGTPGLGETMSALSIALIPDSTMFVGIEPDKALDMMELEFREGSAAAAKEALKTPGHLIVTEEFRVLKNLHVGDKLSLMTLKGKRDFTICGVVWSPGIDVMVQMFDLRGSMETRSVFTVFGSLDDARDQFGWNSAFLLAANMEQTADRDGLLKQIKEQLGDRGWKAGDTRKIKREIVAGFDRALFLISTIAFAAMAVAALGVMNTLMASVRSRQWQFGILRAIGVTRDQLLRLVLAEALLLAFVGVALGLGVGLLLSVNAMGLSRVTIGYVPPLAIPWGMLAFGTGLILTLSLLASLWPALTVARAQPLALLQAGRSAA